jgi:nucleoside-diphosphate-sugar epimerase
VHATTKLSTLRSRFVIAVVGAETDVGRRVAEQLRRGDHRHNVVELPMAGGRLPDACRTLVLMSLGDHDALARRRRSAVAGLSELLDQATRCQVDRVVLLSSAMVYGAWPNNPVPLTEDALLRPDHDFAFARQLAAAELIVDTWRREDPRRRVAVVRPVPAMAEDGTSSVVRALAAGYGLRAGEDDAPCQFVHLDDVASAVSLAVEEQLDGVFNVAPEGAIPAATVRLLAGSRPRLRLPGRAADVAAQLRWRFQRGPIPPGLRPYTRWPWLVASDRLRQRGWRATATNDQVYVEGTESRWWNMLTPQRKQELSLALFAMALVGIVIMTIRMIRRIVTTKRAGRSG